ncbi:MAG: GGDEF domain-containing protein [Planctomycetota bacterium]
MSHPSRADTGGVNTLQQQIRSRIEGLSYLPTTAAVAVKFVELGKNPDAEPSDYARIIGADSSLASKLLALANSSWAGVRTRVTTVKMAVNLLGLGTVRTLAISYCMTGLHNELRLSPVEAERFWEAGLYKAVAAKNLARRQDAKAADEAFVAGLFQDFAVAVMYSVARDPYMQLLEAPATSVRTLLEAERELFAMDHTEVGRALAQKLELPDIFVDSVAFHHNYSTLSELVENAGVRDGCYAAALLPHMLHCWNQDDRGVLERFLQERGSSLMSFVSQVQTEFDQLYRYFNEGRTAQAQLSDLLVATARENADQTTDLVMRVNELLHEAAKLGVTVNHQAPQLEDKARRDPLTRALTRAAFTEAAADLLANTARCNTSLAVLYLDIDRFKSVNDTHGHAVGDQVLLAVASALRELLPAGALLARLGGDEIAMLVGGFTAQEISALAGRIVAQLATRPVHPEQPGRNISTSVGLLFVPAGEPVQQLDVLLHAADQLMYAAKQAGGTRVQARELSAARRPAGRLGHA